MTLLICVTDFWEKKTYYKLTPSKTHANKKIIYSLEILPTIRSEKCRNVKLPVVDHIRKCVRCNIDGVTFFYLNRELLHFLEYRRVLSTHLNYEGVQILCLQIVQPQKDIIDWEWNRMLTITLWEKIEIEYLMSWLSTLGGAFSALGEQFSKCADMAGKISQKQLIIGVRLGDPFLQARCKLFYSISLIQTGRLRSAKYIIREQYKFARCHKDVDGRLVKMCQGIWLKLQYEYDCRLKKRKKELLSKRMGK